MTPNELEIYLRNIEKSISLIKHAWSIPLAWTSRMQATLTCHLLVGQPDTTPSTRLWIMIRNNWVVGIDSDKISTFRVN